jgi:tetratricopeptide (TPR) repeat protein
MSKNILLLVILAALFSVSSSAGDHRSYYHYMLGDKYYFEEDFESAILEYVRASVYDPDSSEIKLKIASCYLQTGNVEPAVSNIQRALELDPDNMEAKMLYADVMIIQKDFKRALNLCSDVLKHDAENTKAMHCKATMLLGIGRNSEALAVLKDHLSKNEDDERAYYGVGLIYDSMSNLSEAERYYKKALGIDPSYPPAAADLMGIYETIYSGDTFIKELEKLAEVTSQKVVRDKIVRTCVEMASKNKDNKKAALIYYSKAIRQLEKLESDYPELSNIKMQKALIQDEMGDPTGAMRTLEAATAQSPGNERALYYLATLYEKNNRKPEALTLMERILEINPDNADALNYVGYSYADSRKDLKKAKELVDRALKIMPNDPYVTDSMGWVYYNIGDYSNARVQLEKAFDIVKEKKVFEPEIIEHLMSVYRHLGLNDKIKQTYSDLINSGIYKDKKAELKTLFEKFNDIQPERKPASVDTEEEK